MWVFILMQKHYQVIPYIGILTVTIASLIPNQPPLAYILFWVYILMISSYFLDKKVFIFGSVCTIAAFTYTSFAVDFMGLQIGNQVDHFTFFLYIFGLAVSLQWNAAKMYEKIDFIQKENITIIQKQKENQEKIEEGVESVSKKLNKIKQDSTKNRDKFQSMGLFFDEVTNVTDEQSGEVEKISMSLKNVNTEISNMLEKLNELRNYGNLEFFLTTDYTDLHGCVWGGCLT